MTFLSVDEVRTGPDAVIVGGHLLELARPDGFSTSPAGWRLRCGSCLAEVFSSHADVTARRLLPGACSLPAVGGRAAVSWVWGPLPRDVADVPRPQVVFDRGPRRPMVATAHTVAPDLWFAACPGRARRAIVVLPGELTRRRVQRLSPGTCPTRWDDEIGRRPVQ